MTLEQLVDRHYAEINSGDFSDVAEIFGADVVTQVPGSAPMSGIDPFVAYGQGFLRAFPDGRIHRDRYVEAGDRIIVEGRFTGTNTGPLETPAGGPAADRPVPGTAVRRRLPGRRRQDHRAPHLLRPGRDAGPARPGARAGLRVTDRGRRPTTGALHTQRPGPDDAGESARRSSSGTLGDREPYC